MTARPRRKAPKLAAPQTIEEATALLGDYAAKLTKAAKIRADADASIAAIQAARDEFLKPLEEGMKDLFRQLRAWWAVAGPAITEGKRKSAEIAGCIVGERTTTPKLALGNRKAEDWIADLLDDPDLTDFVRVKEELDRQALIKAIGDPKHAANDKLLILGLRRSQTDEFFIDRAAEKAPAVEQVELQEAAE
jgi:phage host-nuclease inhibitor protein Gam